MRHNFDLLFQILCFALYEIVSQMFWSKFLTSDKELIGLLKYKCTNKWQIN